MRRALGRRNESILIDRVLMKSLHCVSSEILNSKREGVRTQLSHTFVQQKTNDIEEFFLLFLESHYPESHTTL